MHIQKASIFRPLSLAALSLTFVCLAGRAEAGLFNCSSALASGDRLDVEVSFNNPGSKGPQVYKSNVSLGGKSLPALGTGCFYSDRPSTRFIKCAHQSGRLRIEIYPTVETTSGTLKLMQYIIWDGGRAQKGGFRDCRQS